MQIKARSGMRSPERPLRARDEFYIKLIEHRAAAHEMQAKGECDGSGHLQECESCKHSAWCREWRHQF